MNSNEFRPAPSEGATFDKMPTPMVAIDRQGIITFANKQALNDFDHSMPDAIPNHNFMEFLSEDSKVSMPQKIKEVLAAAIKLRQGVPSSEITLPEFRIKTVSGKERYIRVSPSIVRGRPDEKAVKHIKGAEIYITDITDEVRERELIMAASEVHDNDLEIGDVIRRVKDNIQRVIPHDTANIMVFDDPDNPQWLTVLDKWGYNKAGIPNALPFSKKIDAREKKYFMKMLESKSPEFVPDTALSPDYDQPETGSAAKSWMGAPLCIGEGDQMKVIGFINVNNIPGYSYDRKDADTLQKFADAIAINIQKSIKYKDKSHEAITDPLTGVFNRRFLEAEGNQEFDESKRSGNPLSVIMTDGDNFKYYNEKYGHPVGDQIIRAFSAKTRDGLRSSDILARYGGEEFTGILPQSDLSDALNSAERIRESIEADPIINTEEHGDIHATVTIGIAMQDRVIDENFGGLVKRADEALYVAKLLGGKNTVGIHIPEKAINTGGKEITRFEQVVVAKKIESPVRNINTGISGVGQVEVSKHIWEVRVFRKDPSYILKPEENITSAYSEFASYRIYRDLKQATGPGEWDTNYIFRNKNIEEWTSPDDIPSARLLSGEGNYMFSATPAYHNSVDGGEEPEDSFAWVNIIFPQKASWPDSRDFKAKELY